jgi:hypothetical protein
VLRCGTHPLTKAAAARPASKSRGGCAASISRSSCTTPSGPAPTPAARTHRSADGSAVAQSPPLRPAAPDDLAPRASLHLAPSCCRACARADGKRWWCTSSIPHSPAASATTISGIETCFSPRWSSHTCSCVALPQAAAAHEPSAFSCFQLPQVSLQAQDAGHCPWPSQRLQASKLELVQPRSARVEQAFGCAAISTPPLARSLLLARALTLLLPPRWLTRDSACPAVFILNFLIRTGVT